METLPDQFAKALERVEVSGTKLARAMAAHLEVRALLETSPALLAWGVDTVLIGSYKRRTGIYPGNDVDIFVKLNALDVTASAAEVFTAVCKILVDHYESRAVPRDRSVKIEFDVDDGFSIDVVPAVKCAGRWAIPEHDRGLWSNNLAAWVETDPERLGELTTNRNRNPEIDGRGPYVPTVKLMRQARSHHRGDAKPGGLYIELVTYDAFNAGVTGESFAEIFATTLAYASTRLASAVTNPLLDPALDTPYAPAPNVADLTSTAALFSALSADASTALALPRCEAAVLWRQILGANERGTVFPLPPGCDETGNAIGVVTANRARGSDEARGFG